MAAVSQGTLMASDLKSDPQYSFWLQKGYVGLFQQLVSDTSSIVEMVRREYQTGKVSRQAADYVSKLADNYQDYYDQTVTDLQNQLTVIQHSYDQQKSTTYSDPTSALNEILRRQDMSARLALMTNDQLKRYADDQGQGLITLPEVDQQAIISELDKRGITFELTQFQALKANQYKSDPNWQRITAVLKNTWAVSPAGENTSLAYLSPSTDKNGSFDIKFISIGAIKQAAGMDYDAGKALVDQLSQAADWLKAFSEAAKPLADIQAAKVQDGMDYVESVPAVKVADNDPRINPDGSHWSWIAMYTFLAERFGDDPAVVGNAIYSDPTDPGYDIEKRYDLMMSLYKQAKAEGKYHALKIVDTDGKNPETLSDDDIKKLFGDLD